jgi:diketogulonate reductase-like aldo/keto reductase
VQNQFSLAFASSEPELELCDELGIVFLPWSPLGGIASAAALGDRFAVFQQVADARGVSPQAICLAWDLAKSPQVMGPSRAPRDRRASATPLTRRRSRLSSEELTALDAA